MGVETQAADKCGATAYSMGQFMDGETAVANEDDRAPWKPTAKLQHTLPGPVGQQLVPAPLRLGVAHGRQDRGPEAKLAWPVVRLDPRVLAGQVVDDAAGAVRGVVVDDQYVGLGSELVDQFDESGDVLALVVGGDGYQQSGRSCLHPGGLRPYADRIQSRGNRRWRPLL